MCATQETGKGEFVLAILWFIPASKHILHALKQIVGHIAAMLSVVDRSPPDELADVEGTLEYGQLPVGLRFILDSADWCAAQAAAVFRFHTKTCSDFVTKPTTRLYKVHTAE